MATYSVTFSVEAGKRASVEALAAKKEVTVHFEPFEKSMLARVSEAESLLDDAKSEVESLKDELQDWYDNLPESFQQGDKGSQLEEAVQNLESIYDALESVDVSGLEKAIEEADPKAAEPVEAKTLGCSLTVGGSNIKGVTNAQVKLWAQLAVGGRVYVKKNERAESRSDRLSAAETKFEEAKQILADIRDEAESRKDDPELKEAEEAWAAVADEAESFEGELDQADFSSVEFPTMYG